MGVRSEVTLTGDPPSGAAGGCSPAIPSPAPYQPHPTAAQLCTDDPAPSQTSLGGRTHRLLWPPLLEENPSSLTPRPPQLLLHSLPLTVFSP